MQFNWVDIIIAVVAFYFFIEGWEAGLLSLIASFLSLLAALWLALRYYSAAAAFIALKFGVPSAWANILGYVGVALLSEFVLSELLSRIVSRFPDAVHVSRTNRVLGSFVSVVNGLIILAFFLILATSLPLRGTIRQDITGSFLGSRLVRLGEQYGGTITGTVQTVGREATKFLTVEPKSNESIPIDVTPSSLTTDEAAEREMLSLVNAERAKAGVGALVSDPALASLARAKSRDMFVRHYFSHIDPDGHDVAYRAEAAGISFSVIGENLAYAPDVQIAHQGLMNSPGHRRNILDPAFHRVGIGIISGGIYGEMFTQEFTN
ncbi:CvpA family protein [Patescibacteria group bacterium]|nr:CvpA family protein [Patescibacteria group bacterium]